MAKYLILLALFLVIAQAQKIVPQVDPAQKKGIQYKMFLFPEECFEKFFYKFDFSDGSCIAKTMSKILSTGIVVFSALLKVPQIMKILNNKSVEGLSFGSIFNESIMYSFNIAYNIHKGNEFMLYGENLFILIQNLLVLYMFKVFDKSYTSQKLINSFVLFLVITVPIVSQQVPVIVFTFSIYINMILIFFSRGPQIMLNFKNKSTGQLAAITLLLSLVGTLVRMFTIFVSAGDWLYNAQNIEAAVLNGILVLQLFAYKKAKVQ